MRYNFKIVLVVFILSFILVGCDQQANTPENYQIILMEENGVIADNYQTDSLDLFSESSYIPTKDGYTFIEWTQLVNNINLQIFQAIYEINQYTISFNSNDGSEVANITIDYNEEISLPDNPIKDGNYFGGWYLDSNFNDAFSLQSMPSENITLYAKWCSSPFNYRLDEENNAIITGILTELNNTSIVIPEDIEDHTVISIDDNAFMGHSEITELTIPDTVTSLPQAVLKDLTQLSVLTTPFIGENRDGDNGKDGLSYFFYTEEITSFHDINNEASYIPTTLKTLFLTDTSIVHAFALAATQIEYVSLNEGITEIGDFAFSGSNIGMLHIPSTVITVDGSAFIAMPNLISISVDENNPYYSSAFLGHGLYNKDKTELIRYPSGINAVEFIVPDGVLKIGRSAFEGNDKLVKVYIPDSVTEIGPSSFQYSTSLTTVEFTENSELELIGTGAFRESSIVYISIPVSVETIERLAFSETRRLESVTFAENSQLTTIESEAFSGAEILHEIIIPISVENMGMAVFGSIYNELTVYCEASSQPEGWEAWYDTRSRITVVWGYINS